MLGLLPILPIAAPPSDGDLGPLPPSQLQYNPRGEQTQEAEDEQNKSNSTPASIATHTRAIGIIHPPPDIRTIVDKTASFVAKNGPEFEKRILVNNAGNPKFNFLNGSDPYHAYYQHRLSEFRVQHQNGAPQLPDTSAFDSTETEKASIDSNDATEKTDPSAKFRPVRKVLDPPEAEQYTIRLLEGITGEELDIIKLTAQFVARNGKSFLTGLTSRENNNPQFLFLKPTHSMFRFFTSVADAYSKVLMPPKGLTDKLKKSVTNMTTVLEQCLHRLEWEQSQEQARQKAEDEIQQEKLLMSMIDWHDFVVVENIDFADDEDDDIPPPMSLDEVIRRSKMSAVEEEEVVELGKEVEMEMDEEEVQLVQEGMEAARHEENNNDDMKEARVISEENEPQMRIVKNWKRPEERAPAERNPTKYVISPITGELIPVNDMSEHMRISLIDPKFKEQKERMFAKIKETTLAKDDEISRNIVGLARTRPDIFGTTEEEVSNAVKAEIEKKNDEQPKQVIWDGHTGSIGQAATQAMSHNADDQIDDGRFLPGPAAPVRTVPPPPGLALNLPHVPPNAQYSTITNDFLVPPQSRPWINRIVTPLCPPPSPMQMDYGQQPYMMNRPPPPPMGQPMSVNPPVPPPPGSQPTPLGQSPYMPQHSMPMVAPLPMPRGPPLPDVAPPPLPDLYTLTLLVPCYGGAVRVTVSLQVDDEKLKAKSPLEITVQSLSEMVGSLKEKIEGEIQRPANKQKLSGKAGFLKDNLSLAYYNVGAGESLTLSLRERGGRKSFGHNLLNMWFNTLILLMYCILQGGSKWSNIAQWVKQGPKPKAHYQHRQTSHSRVISESGHHHT
ncbi:Pre-mRNA splicing factor PRP21-like protein [Artemisia annua]|uniref:Pre-mRNA splicing factor PRP21-like protein n=1 Tax=Artemisia annua TaxID=35608 RepID=A0A2U1NSH3_ARTAN|nr:Pre-mRNA splicing factor PRP21-like protein [Artemisia annua]